MVRYSGPVFTTFAATGLDFLHLHKIIYGVFALFKRQPSYSAFFSKMRRISRPISLNLTCYLKIKFLLPGLSARACSSGHHASHTALNFCRWYMRWCSSMHGTHCWASHGRRCSASWLCSRHRNGDCRLCNSCCCTSMWCCRSKGETIVRLSWRTVDIFIVRGVGLCLQEPGCLFIVIKSV